MGLNSAYFVKTRRSSGRVLKKSSRFISDEVQVESSLFLKKSSFNKLIARYSAFKNVGPAPKFGHV